MRDTSHMNPTAKLALEDGTVYTGMSFGANGEVDGEVCFNTSMSGYQEIVTDPSYRGQIVTMTYPEIGNYGVNSQDVESGRPHLSGFVVRELSRRASNFRSDGDLHDYLAAAGVVGLAGIDTRALVRRYSHSRRDERRDFDGRSGRRQPDRQGPRQPRAGRPRPGPRSRAGPGSAVERDAQHLVEVRGHLFGRSGCQDRTARADAASEDSASKARPPHVVALDYGMKWNIARHLHDQGCRVTVLPGTATAEEVLAEKPDGVFLSNGPGDPEPLDYADRDDPGSAGQARRSLASAWVISCCRWPAAPRRSS